MTVKEWALRQIHWMASTVMNTSTLPREIAFCTHCFTASSAKLYIRGIFTVQSRYRLLTERTSTVISRLFRTSLARP